MAIACDDHADPGDRGPAVAGPPCQSDDPEPTNFISRSTRSTRGHLDVRDRAAHRVSISIMARLPTCNSPLPCRLAMMLHRMALPLSDQAMSSLRQNTGIHQDTFGLDVS